MPDAFSFRLLATDGAARCGEIVTPHGAVATPAFLPIGTQATVKGLAPEVVRASGADIVLANTYPLMLRPGAERIAALGGLHRFMNWPRAILTDSGGFQVMSLSQLRKVEDKGVTFRSHLDGAIVELSPERAIEIQHLLGSDIAMQLDECLQLPASQAELRRAMQLSLAWAERSKRAFERTGGPALFAIVQGGDDLQLRAESARVVTDMGFHGYAIGGLAVGEPQQVMLRIVEAVAAALPAERPRYLMGGGRPPRGAAALSQGSRHARGPRRGGGTRHRHVRLRPADAQRPPRARLHPLRADQSQECAPRRRPAPDRRGECLPRRARLFARLSPPPRQGQRDARRDPAHDDQPRLLPRTDGRHADGDCVRNVRGFPRGRARKLGAGVGIVFVARGGRRTRSSQGSRSVASAWQLHKGLDAAPASAQNKTGLNKNGAAGTGLCGRRSVGDAQHGHQPQGQWGEPLG